MGFPTIPIPFVSPWVAAFRFMYDPAGLVKQGVEAYNRQFFKIATLQGEYVLISDRDKVAEYIRAPDDVLNMQEAADDVRGVAVETDKSNP